MNPSRFQQGDLFRSPPPARLPQPATIPAPSATELVLHLGSKSYKLRVTLPGGEETRLRLRCTPFCTPAKKHVFEFLDRDQRPLAGRSFTLRYEGGWLGAEEVRLQIPEGAVAVRYGTQAVAFSLPAAP